MIPRSLIPFISRLRRETDDGSIVWISGAEDTYICNKNKYTVTISYVFDEDQGLSVYRFGMTTKGNSAGFVVTGDEEDIAEMRNLFSSASISAGGFNEIENDFFA